jgi:hypothetical protein
MSDTNAFLHGAIAASYVVIALFFLRFYFHTRDRLFALFSASFWVLAAIRVMMVVTADPSEHHYLYWIRFAAYLLILGAIVDKNFPWRGK